MGMGMGSKVTRLSNERAGGRVEAGHPMAVCAACIGRQDGCNHGSRGGEKEQALARWKVDHQH